MSSNDAAVAVAEEEEESKGYAVGEEFASLLEQPQEGGAVTTFAFTGEGAEEMAAPRDLVFSLDGKLLFVADYYGHKIRVVNVGDGTVTTLAGSGEEDSEDGVGAAASFSSS